MRIVLLALGLLVPVLVACGDPEADPAAAAPRRDHDVTAPRLSPARSSVSTRERPPLSDPPSPDELAGPGNTRVRVLDERGEPIPGASIQGRRDRATTDDSGEALLHVYRGMGMPSQMRDDQTVLVAALGRVPVRHVCAAGSGRVEVVRLSARGLEVRGAVRDVSGAPVEGLALELRYEDEAPLELRTDLHGAFATRSAPPRAGTLHVADRAWTCRPVPVVPPQRDVALVVYRTAWLRGTFEIHHRGTSRWAYVTLETNQGWRRRVRPDDPFEIPCCPGEVVLRADDRELARLVVAEGGEVADLRLPVDVTPWSEADRPPRPPPPGTLELDLAPIGGEEAYFVAEYADLGLVPLGYRDGDDPARVALRSRLVRWLGVRFRGRAWRVPVSDGARVRVQPPPTAPIRLSLRDRWGRAVDDGSIYVRWPGTRHVAAAAASDHPSPPIPAWHESGVGAGAWDLVWIPGYHAADVLLLRGVTMPDPPMPLDLGTVVVPEAAQLRVLVASPDGAPVAGAVVRLRGHDRDLAVRAGPDGVAGLRVLDPTELRLEAEDERGRRGTLRLADDGIPPLARIRLGR